jgi:hypothetical protein
VCLPHALSEFCSTTSACSLRRKRRAIFGIMCRVIVGLVLTAIVVTAIVLVIYFLYPRKPTVEEQNSYVSQFILNGSAPSMIMNVTVNVLVVNPNYVDIYLRQLFVNIYYKGNYVGSATESDVDFPRLSSTTTSVDAYITMGSSQAPLIADMILYASTHGGTVPFYANGTATVTYLVVTAIFPISFSFNAST